jgi:hypothetical protein
LALGESADITQILALNANLCAMAFDFVSRQKIGSVMVNQFILQQLPVIPPHTYTEALLAFIVPRVLELTYTAWDMQPFARDLGYHGPPFVWDEARRFLLRCELDALYFHLYQVQREDVDYILESFPIVKRKDEAAHGEYRTKRVIWEMYDQMAALPLTPVPAPRQPSPQSPLPQGEGLTTYTVPDVSQWVTWLNPPPADASVAHQG